LNDDDVIYGNDKKYSVKYILEKVKELENKNG